MPPDHPPHHPPVSEVIEAARFAIALACGVHQGQLAGCPDAGLFLGGQKAGLDGYRNFLGKANADETSGGHGVAIMN